MKHALNSFAPHSWMRLVKISNRRSQVLLKCLSLTANYYLKSPATAFLLKNRVIIANRNTKFKQ